MELALDGTITVKARMGSPGTLDFIVDIAGYFQLEGPVLTPGGATATFIEDGPAVTVDPGITVTNVASPNLVSVTVTISNPQNGAAEVLAEVPASCPSLTVTPGLNSLSITGNQPLATYQTCLRSVTYSNSSQDPGMTARTISFTADDGTTTGGTTETVNITPSNDAPVLGGTGTVTFTEDGGPIAASPTITVTDEDSPNLASATVQITNNYQNGQDVLSFTNTVNITGVFTPATGTLTLTGSDTRANWETALRNVRYDNTSANPSTASRTVTWIIHDGTDPSLPVTSTIDLTAVANAPVVTAGGILNYTENDPPTAIDPALTVTDPDSANLASATVQITNNYQNGQDVLSFTNTVNITGVFTPASGTLTLTGSDTVANWQKALRSVRYNNTSESPSTAVRTVTWIVSDGSASSTPVTSTVNVTVDNDAPMVTAGGVLSYTENDPPTAIDTGLTVTDPDSANLASATVHDHEQLPERSGRAGFTNTVNITGVVHAGLGDFDPDWFGHGGELADGLAQRDLQQHLGGPVDPGADGDLDRQRRRRVEHAGDQHDQRHGGARCAGGDSGRHPQLHGERSADGHRHGAHGDRRGQCEPRLGDGADHQQLLNGQDVLSFANTVNITGVFTPAWGL